MDIPTNTFIIGAPRSGTTSLHNYLGQHPNVFMSRLKEPRYFAYKDEDVDCQGPADPVTFNRSTVTDRDEYVSLFRGVNGEKIIGETSPIYMYRSNVAAGNIAQAVEDPRIIAILRNPIDRAYSDFLNMVRLAREPLLDFRTALEKESERVEKNWSPFYYYTEKGMYARQLENYYDVFDESQIKVFLFEELVEDEQRVMDQIMEFLNLERLKLDIDEKHNRSRFPKMKCIHRVASYPSVKSARGLFRGPVWGLIDWMRRQNLTEVTSEPRPSTRKSLENKFRSEINHLQNLIDRSLNHWL
jgi:hypothetical protein